MNEKKMVLQTPILHGLCTDWVCPQLDIIFKKNVALRFLEKITFSLTNQLAFEVRTSWKLRWDWKFKICMLNFQQSTQKGVKRQYIILHCQEARYLGQTTFSKDGYSSQMLFCNVALPNTQEMCFTRREGIHFPLPWVWVFSVTTLINSTWQTWCSASFRLSLVWLRASFFQPPGMLTFGTLPFRTWLPCCETPKPHGDISADSLSWAAVLTACHVKVSTWTFQPSWAFRWLQPTLTPRWIAWDTPSENYSAESNRTK